MIHEIIISCYNLALSLGTRAAYTTTTTTKILVAKFMKSSCSMKPVCSIINHTFSRSKYIRNRHNIYF